MSSRVFQSVIVQMKEATDRMIGVIDADSTVISCSDTSRIGEKWPEAVIKLNSAPDSIVVVDKKTFKPLVSWSAYFDYAVFAEGDDEIARSLCVMAYVALNGAKTYYEEKHDKGTFVKNIITDNILPGDIYIRAKELHFVTDAPRAVFLIRQVGRADVASVDVLSGMFPDKQQDFVLSINETDIADVKLLKRGGDISRFGQNADFAGSLLFGDFAGNFAEGFGGCGADRNRNAGLFHDGIANHQGYVLQVFPVVNFGKSFVNRINFNFAEVAFNQPHNAFGHVGVEFVVGRQRYAAGGFEHFFDFEIGCAHRDTECLGFI